MSVKTSNTQADLERLAASLAAGRDIDADLKQRIRATSAQLREERLKKYGFLNVAVSLIRAIREE